jgi:hypothetical protein
MPADNGIRTGVDCAVGSAFFAGHDMRPIIRQDARHFDARAKEIPSIHGRHRSNSGLCLNPSRAIVCGGAEIIVDVAVDVDRGVIQYEDRLLGSYVASLCVPLFESNRVVDYHEACSGAFVHGQQARNPLFYEVG